ncbi:MAG: hypothetical protein F6K37_13060 [Moorea sp. SIO4E2]|uniref:hypothetical protein n=1 Tax=Moorena sp. SIO4E2 TaxID=2607826 RepID=UPI0013B85E40|nr:hypothetical protein [Moorena sp. SIO4E2]NEQ06829.1 hypothetical protein [Moorena sp. SIO4E2]
MRWLSIQQSVVSRQWSAVSGQPSAYFIQKHRLRYGHQLIADTRHADSLRLERFKNLALISFTLLKSLLSPEPLHQTSWLIYP